MVPSIHAFLDDIWASRGVIYSLARRDFRNSYMGSYLGFIWVFLQPLLFIGVLYFVFTSGLKASSAGAVPFSLYLVCGMVPWLYFVENFSRNTSVILAHGYLVTKVDFRLSLLPIVTLLSSLPPHLMFIGFAVAVCWLNGYPPGLYALQILYYLVAMLALLLGLGWLTSSTNVFVRDVAKVVAVFTQFGFWLTPVFWTIDSMPAAFHFWIKLNPAYYFVSGYRDALIYHVWFWERPVETLYYWGMTLSVLVLGMFVFRNLRPHIAEVI
jgi:lipopolysaccharide transport system permease protein